MTKSLLRAFRGWKFFLDHRFKGGTTKTLVLCIEYLDNMKYPKFHYVNSLFYLWRTNEYHPAIYNPTTRIAKYYPSLNG